MSLYMYNNTVVFSDIFMPLYIYINPNTLIEVKILMELGVPDLGTAF